MILVALLCDNQLVMFERALYDCLNLSQIKRLHYIIKSAKAHRLNSAFDRLQATDHHDHGIRRDAFHMWDHFQAAHAGHSDIADDKTKFFLPDANKSLFRRASGFPLQIGGEEVSQNLSYLSFVIDD